MEGSNKHKVSKVGFFKKLSRHSWKLKFYWSSLRWKRVHLPVSFMDDVVFRIVSLFEAIVLVLSACVFYLFFGCHFWWLWIQYNSDHSHFLCILLLCVAFFLFPFSSFLWCSVLWVPTCITCLMKIYEAKKMKVFFFLLDLFEGWFPRKKGSRFNGNNWLLHSEGGLWIGIAFASSSSLQCEAVSVHYFCVISL